MMEILTWLISHWQILLTVLAIGFILSMIKPIKKWFSNVSEGFREALTPGGFIVLVILLILYFVIKGALNV